MGSGFVSEAPCDVLLFCKSDRGPALFVRARDRKCVPTDVRLSLVPNERYSPCSPGGHEPHMLFESILPPLAPPPGARLFSRIGGGSDDVVESNATLHTDLDLVAIGTHYVAHLKDAGWSLLNEGGDGPQTWSTWSFYDETGQPWNGVSTALRLPDTPHESVGQMEPALRARRLKARTHGGRQCREGAGNVAPPPPRANQQQADRPVCRIARSPRSPSWKDHRRRRASRR